MYKTLSYPPVAMCLPSNEKSRVLRIAAGPDKAVATPVAIIRLKNWFPVKSMYIMFVPKGSNASFEYIVEPAAQVVGVTVVRAAS